ncbi:TniB family NTP-binding protein [Leptolyngbya cf. ectocarpi LEGE 11479]|uniref:TniB family NTP-binding protein n=1 Tax=Leptolyngbya cf. ectocarpi LEGE 11479 TaxID=1828722 RepID=A0A928X572_LEPEC|nr:TniB family NTP-binding protein [Leptolyngbya ectocarpi]MBE9066998.1 TniB family NTP-binding protein [Leptolyngbya cf. ectocarpi LEGE 11479]
MGRPGRGVAQRSHRHPQSGRSTGKKVARSRSKSGTSGENRDISVPLAESVFTVGTPITQPHQFFGRQRIVKRLFNLFKTHPLQNAAIIGQKRAGKTSLLNYLRTITTTPTERLRPGQRNNWLPNPEIYRWIFVDFQDPRMAHRERLLGYLLEAMGLPVPIACDLEQFMEQISEQIQQPTVVLMDEIGVGLQRCPELNDTFWDSLRSLANHYANGSLAFILAASERPIDLAKHNDHSSPFFNIFGHTTTPGRTHPSLVCTYLINQPLKPELHSALTLKNQAILTTHPQ